MERVININGHTYDLVLVSNDGTQWVQKYHITTCALGYLAGEYWCDCGEISSIGCWKFLKSILPEKKKKYRPYNDEELERLFDDGVILVNKTIIYDGAKSSILSYKNGEVYLMGEWVGRRELLNCWKHRDGRHCGIKVDNVI